MSSLIKKLQSRIFNVPLIIIICLWFSASKNISFVFLIIHKLRYKNNFIVWNYNVLHEELTLYMFMDPPVEFRTALFYPFSCFFFILLANYNEVNIIILLWLLTEMCIVYIYVYFLYLIVKKLLRNIIYLYDIWENWM